MARSEDPTTEDTSMVDDYTDSDTGPNTTASSVAGDAVQLDGRKRRSEAHQLRKAVFGKKHGRLNESKVGYTRENFLPLQSQC
jgi:hypothetical protein